MSSFFKNDKSIVNFYDLDDIDSLQLKRVVIVCKYNGKWLLCKSKKRTTWELPGGKIECNEDPLTVAKRELYEETGAIEYNIEKVCLFFVSQPALLCFENIIKKEEDLKYEIGEVKEFDDLPENLTYPDIHPALFRTTCNIINRKGS